MSAASDPRIELGAGEPADPPRIGTVPADGPLIELVSVWRTFAAGESEVRALQGVDLAIGRGEFVAIMGSSGSGKSTLLHLLGCLDRPTRGTYRLAGRDVGSLAADELAALRNHEIGFVFQSFNLIPRTSALENVELPLVYGGVSAGEQRARAREALREVGLGDREHHLPNQLSGGQQQRTAIARAIVGRPSLLLADEPTGNLDSATSLEIIALFQRLNRERGVTVILVTHEPDVAGYAARVVTVRDGRIVSDVAQTAALARGEAA
jgi:putative ABC transport system ATP-binding protein